MEGNANPSMNMYIERELPGGDTECILSELDKYLKTLVISDALHIIKSKEDLKEFG